MLFIRKLVISLIFLYAFLNDVEDIWFDHVILPKKCHSRQPVQCTTYRSQEDYFCARYFSLFQKYIDFFFDNDTILVQIGLRNTVRNSFEIKTTKNVNLD